MPPRVVNPTSLLQCGPNAYNATKSFISLALEGGGTRPARIDSANDYFNLGYVAAAIHESGYDRSEIFLLSKIGNAFAMGQEDAKSRERGSLWCCEL